MAGIPRQFELGGGMMATLRQLQASRGITPEDYTPNSSGGFMGPSRTLSSGTTVRDYVRGPEEQEEYDRYKGIEERRKELRLSDAENELSRQEEFNRKWGPAATNVDVASMGSKEPYKGPTHFTNIPGTIGKWKGEGVESKDIGFIAENPADLEAATKAGVGRVEKSTTFKAPRQPSEDDLISNEITGGMWGKVMEREGWESDPRRVNPVIKGVEARKKYEAQFPKPRLGTQEFTQWEKDANRMEKTAHDEAKENKEFATKTFAEVSAFAKDKSHIAEAKTAKAEAHKQKVLTIQKQVSDLMSSWTNYDLTPQQYAVYANLKQGERVAPTRAPLKSSVLKSINAALLEVGLNPLTQKAVRVTVPLPWTDRKWSETFTGEETYNAYSYPEDTSGGGRTPAPVAKPQYQVGQVVNVPGKGPHKFMGNDQWQPVR
jgi:hypothetical protein